MKRSFFKSPPKPPVVPAESSLKEIKKRRKYLMISLILIVMVFVVTIPFSFYKQELRQRADVVYSDITPEYYCLGLGNVDCNGVKTASESALGCIGLSDGTKAVLDKRYVTQFETVTGSVVMRNKCRNTFDVQSVYLQAKDPNGKVHKFVPGGGSKTTFPGQTVSINNAQLTISPNDPTGDWAVTGGYIDSAGKVYTAGTPTTVTVVPPCTEKDITSTITLDKTNVIVPASLSATVTFKNNCLVNFPLQSTLIQATDPQGNIFDFATSSTPPTPVSLASNSAMTVTGIRLFTSADIMGNWQAFGSFQTQAVGTVSAKWVVGTNKAPFTVATMSAVKIATKSGTPVATKSAAPKSVPKLAKRTILFDFDKSDIKPAYNATLDEIVTYMKANPTAKITIIGYADSTGTTEYNLNLSKQRALAVEAYIVGKGIPSSRMTIDWKGEANPVASNATPAGQAQNRRVEITN